MKSEEWGLKNEEWFNWVNEECGSFLLIIINRCQLSFLQRLHVTNWPVGSTAALRLSGSWQSYSIVARRSTTLLCRWSLSFSTWVSRVTNERRIIITNNRWILPIITEYYWEWPSITEMPPRQCRIFASCFSCDSLTCPLGVPYVCLRFVREMKGNLRCTFGLPNTQLLPIIINQTNK